MGFWFLGSENFSICETKFVTLGLSQPITEQEKYQCDIYFFHKLGKTCPLLSLSFDFP